MQQRSGRSESLKLLGDLALSVLFMFFSCFSSAHGVGSAGVAPRGESLPGGLCFFLCHVIGDVGVFPYFTLYVVTECSGLLSGGGNALEL